MRILRINMSTFSSAYEELDDKNFILGNRALIAEYANLEIPAACEPLGDKNKLIIAVGPLVGLGITSSARVSVGGKSPLTGGIKEANGGGVVGTKMGKHGLRAIIIESQPSDNQSYIIFINKNGADIQPAGSYERMGNYELAQSLLQQHGKDIGIISIGPAGEMKMSSAGVFINDPEGSQSRACARGGMGAVMGSKGVKAIVVSGDGEYKPIVSDKEALKKARYNFHNTIKSNPQTAEVYPKYGTASAVMTLNEMGAMPTLNFTKGSFDNAENISGDALYDLITKRNGYGRHQHRCMQGCIINCSNVVPDKFGNPIIQPLEYETISLVGSNLGISSLDDISKINYICNDIGIDTIETGAALGVAVEAGLLDFGDITSFINLLGEIKQGTPLGRIIGHGAAFTGKAFSISRVPVCKKGQALPGHEPRGIKGMAITYSMSPMGADHTAAVTFRAPLDHGKTEGQMEFSRNLQVNIAAYDSLGFCMFVTPAVGKQPKLTVDIINAVFGTSFDNTFLFELGKKVLKLERRFNLNAGLNDKHDRLAEFLKNEPLPPTNQVVDFREEDYKRFWHDPDFWGEHLDN